MVQRSFVRWVVFVLSAISGLSLLPAPARAESLAEAVVEVLVGAATRTLLNVVIPERVATAHPSPPTPEPRVELSDWVDPSSHSTAKVGRACEQRIVTYLTGTRRFNFLEVKLFNDSDTNVTIDAHSRVFTPAMETTVNARHGFRGMPLRVPAHSGKLLVLGLQKSLFYQLKQFDFVFDVSSGPGRTCQMKVEFSRSLPALTTTFKAASKRDIGVSLGAHLTAGPLRESVGALGQNTTTSMTWHIAVQHGVRAEFSLDSLGGDRFKVGLLLIPGYEYRHFFNPRLSYTFGIGAGPYLFTVNQEQPASAARWAMLVRERMQLQYELSTDQRPLSLALCPTLTFGAFPGGPFGPHELSGGFYTGAMELLIRM